MNEVRTLGVSQLGLVFIFRKAAHKTPEGDESSSENRAGEKDLPGGRPFSGQVDGVALVKPLRDPRCRCACRPNVAVGTLRLGPDPGCLVQGHVGHLVDEDVFVMGLPPEKESGRFQQNLVLRGVGQGRDPFLCPLAGRLQGTKIFVRGCNGNLDLLEFPEAQVLLGSSLYLWTETAEITDQLLLIGRITEHEGTEPARLPFGDKRGGGAAGEY